MKYNLQLGITVTIISALVSSAALKPLNRSADKLNLLDKQGYEVISDAEEILTPMSSDGKDNGVNLSPGIISKPEMLLYGRFYILRKKGLFDGMTNSSSREFLKSENFLLKSYPPSAQQYFGYRSRSQSTTPSASQTSIPTTTERINFLQQSHSSRSGIQTNPNQGKNKKNAETRNDSIFFPEESITSTSKKYLRQRKERIHDESKPFSPSDDNIRPSRSRDRSGVDKKQVISTKESQLIATKLESIRESPPLEFQNENEYEQMNSEEFVTWAKDNLNVQQISNLLQEVNPDSVRETGEGSTSMSTGVTSTSDIQYNSFILVPGLKCPDGERMNHRGVCAPKYVHITSPRPYHHTKIRERTNRGNARRKLAALLKALKKAEEEVKLAMEETEVNSDPTISEGESESSTILSVDGTNG